MTDKQMRAEFEAWYLGEYFITPPIALNCKTHEGMTYGNSGAESSWRAYTAAASSRDELVKRLVGALEYYARHDSFTDYADKAIAEAKAQGYGE